MTVYINEKPTNLPSDDMTVAELIEWNAAGKGGAAVAINDRIVRKADWTTRHLAEGDRVTIIAAAFGG